MISMMMKIMIVIMIMIMIIQNLKWKVQISHNKICKRILKIKSNHQMHIKVKSLV